MAHQCYKTAFIALGLGLALLPLHAKANGLIGTSVTGGLYFTQGNEPTTNFFDPSNGAVPSSGYENSSGSTVSIASPAVEFGESISGFINLANFSASQFTIENISPPGGLSEGSFTMTFSDTAFASLSLTKVSDSFPNGGLTASLTGSQITIQWAGSVVHGNDDYTSTFVMSAVPEPSTWAAVGVGALTLALLRKRRARA